MNIGLDAKKAIVNHTGIGNYSRRVIESLVGRHGEVSRLCLFGPKGEPVVPLATGANAERVTSPIPTRLGYELWRTRLSPYTTMRRLKLDLFHGLSNEIPYGTAHSGAASVVTIHDLIFLTRPETFSRVARAKLTARTRYACAASDAIVAISRTTAADIERIYGTDPSKIHVVYQSINPRYFSGLPDPIVIETLERYGLRSPYLLCVGTIEHRKNQQLVIEALAQMPREYVAVLVGRPTAYLERVLERARQIGVDDRVRVLHGVTDCELHALYIGAGVMCMPSRYEGFGLPVAESMACGTPVIAATGSCLEEAGGADTIYVHPDDSAALAAAAVRLTTDFAFRQSVIDAGRGYATRFSDRAMAQRLMQIYHSII